MLESEVARENDLRGADAMRSGHCADGIIGKVCFAGSIVKVARKELRVVFVLEERIGAEGMCGIIRVRRRMGEWLVGVGGR